MIRFSKCSDGEVKVFDDADTSPVPHGEPDVYWGGSHLYRVWLSQCDLTKIRTSKRRLRGRPLIEWAEGAKQ